MVQSSWFNFPHSSVYSSPNLSSTTIVRPARLDDVSQIAEILTLSFNNFNDLTLWTYPLFKLGISQDLRSRLQNNSFQEQARAESNEADRCCLVAVMMTKIAGKICQNVVGTVELSFRSRSHWYNHQKYAYIANLAVCKNYRRQGVAHKLLVQCEQIAKQKDFKQISLHVLASNKPAQELYQKNGYDIKQVETDLYSLFVTSKRRLLLTKSFE